MGEWVEGTGGMIKSRIGECGGTWRTLKKEHTGLSSDCVSCN